MVLTVTNDGISCLPCIHDDVGVSEGEICGVSKKSAYGSDHIIMSLNHVFGNGRVCAGQAPRRCVPESGDLHMGHRSLGACLNLWAIFCV